MIQAYSWLYYQGSLLVLLVKPCIMSMIKPGWADTNLVPSPLYYLSDPQYIPIWNSKFFSLWQEGVHCVNWEINLLRTLFFVITLQIWALTYSASTVYLSMPVHLGNEFLPSLEHSLFLFCFGATPSKCSGVSPSSVLGVILVVLEDLVCRGLNPGLLHAEYVLNPLSCLTSPIFFKSWKIGSPLNYRLLFE